MKILHIPNYYYPHIGGTEVLCRSEVQSLSEYEQKVICFSEDEKDKVEWIDGVEIIKCGFKMKVASQAVSFSYKKKLCELMESFSPDVVVFHYPNPLVAHYVLKYLPRKTKFVLSWVLDITKQKVLKNFFHFQNLKLLKRADLILSCSPNYIDGSAYLNRFRDKCRIVSPCVNKKWLDETSEIQGKINDIKQKYADKIICFGFGRHVKYKGFEYLIDAARMLPDNYAVIIGGAGPLTNQLMAKASGCRKIDFTGRLNEADLKAYLYACDIFCFPSITKNEAFGIALAEAMYCGKPNVFFEIEGSGVSFVSQNGVTGIEAENCNVEEYAESIIRLGSDAELRQEYGDNAHKRAVELFLPARLAEDINRVIDEVKI